MKVKTINPVVIDGKDISEPSKYLSADGRAMGEFETTLASTESLVDDNFYGAGGDGEDFYDADGDYDDFDGKKATSAQVLAFQKFANQQGYSPKLVEDGKYGAKTQKAIDAHGDAFDALTTKALGIGTTGIKGGGEPTVAEQVEQAKKGKVWDKAKGWIQSGKAQELLGKVQEAGGIKGFFGSFFGRGGAGTTNTGGVTETTTMDTGGLPPEKRGMSKGMKIGLIVGGVVLLGTIIYFATRKKTAKA